MNLSYNNRLGFKVLGYFLLIFAMTYLVNVIVGVGPNLLMRHLETSENIRVFIGGTFAYAVRLLAWVLLPAWAIKRALGLNPWKTMFPKTPTWWKDILFGILLVTSIMVLIFIIEISLGWISLDGWNWNLIDRWSFLRNLWLALLINLTVALGEETLFRGYLLTGLTKAWGKVIGLTLMAIIFATLHLTVAGAQETEMILFLPLLSIPGLVFGWIYFQTHSLWLPIAIHFTWNLMQDELLNLHGRGTNQLTGAVTHQNGPDWIVGTSYGIEVGLVGILAWLVIILAVWSWTSKRLDSSIHPLTD